MVSITTGLLGDYDVTFGQKCMQLHGIILDFKEAKIQWDGMEKPMKPKDKWSVEHVKCLLDKEESADEHDKCAMEIKESK